MTFFIIKVKQYRPDPKMFRHLMIVPAECKKCGFVFAKRDKFRKPGKCPVCKGESIQEPWSVIEEKKG